MKNGVDFWFKFGSLLAVLQVVGSILEARTVLKTSVVFSGEAVLNNSLDLVGDIVLLVFLSGDEELCLLRSCDLKGELFLDLASRSLDSDRFSSRDNLADLAGECSLILVGLPGPIVM